jgi:hypothetical protein
LPLTASRMASAVPQEPAPRTVSEAALMFPGNDVVSLWRLPSQQ